MTTNNKKYHIVLYIILIGAVFTLLFLTLINNQPPLFDEVLFLGNMELYEEVGLSKQFLVEMYDQAPGPLYQIVHTFFKPLTHLQTPGIRLVNVFLFIGTIGLTAVFLKQTKNPCINDYKLAALNLIAVPVVWQSAGMALTEVPAMFFSTLYLCILWITLREEHSVPFKLVLALLTGATLGLSIIGRTNYLVLIPALIVFIIDFKKLTLSFVVIKYLIIVGLVAGVIFVPMFLAWGGMVPPAQRLVSEGEIKIWHGVLAFAYAGLVTLLINPSWFRINKLIVWYMLASYVLFLILNLLWFDVAYGPLSNFVSKILPSSLFVFYPKLIAPALMVFSGFFIYNLFEKSINKLDNQFYIYLALCLFLLLLSCVGVKHLFSSRYVAQASVFLVLIISEKDKIDFFKCLRTFIAIGIGIISLETYLNP